MKDQQETEIERISREYRRRDAAAAASARSGPDHAALFYLHSLEWEVVRILRDGGTDLTASDVLDVGCGAGRLTNRLAELGARSVSGVDLMPARVAAARASYPALDVREANAAQLPFADGSFDLVTHFACLSSVLDDEVRRAIAAEMWRVTRAGGAILSYDLRPAPTPVRAAGAAVRRLQERRGVPAAPQTPIRPIGPGELRALFPHAETLLHRTAILNVALGGVARRSRSAATLLASVPPLRSHLVGLARKPAGA